MTRGIQAGILFGTLVVFLYLVNSNIMEAENRIENGTPVYMELAPVDPRSLIQGDYMRLDYALERELQTALGLRADTPPAESRGQTVVRLGEDNVAQFVRVYEGAALAEDELLINYRLAGSDVRVGVDSFFFQEGLADDYADAEYADVRVTPGGGVMLIDLVGDEFQSLVDAQAEDQVG